MGLSLDLRRRTLQPDAFWSVYVESLPQIFHFSACVYLQRSEILKPNRAADAAPVCALPCACLQTSPLCPSRTRVPQASVRPFHRLSSPTPREHTPMYARRMRACAPVLSPTDNAGTGLEHCRTCDLLPQINI